MKRMALIVLAAGLAASTAQAAVLDGKNFAGVVVDRAKDASEARSDEFLFKNGRFTSALGRSAGYGAGDYSAEEKDGIVRFKAETVSESGGRMSWSGVVVGSGIEGSVATVENGQKTDSWFKGELKS